jgi:glyoxylase-like metal-dependent hydrolase (beta-lactamase superfamily II)
MTLPAYVEPLSHGIHAIDTGFQRDGFDAAYLLVHEGRAAFVDTGTNFALPRLLGALDALGLARDAVDWVIPTHVHLDHAGGAGALMRELPAARMLVHPRGLRHMVDPSALAAGALAIYGPEEMARSYGDPVPVDPGRTVPSTDGMTVHLAGRPLELVDTPGHARHHHCVWDAASHGWFTGDTFGISYRELDDAAGRPWIFPTTTPVQFEPEVLRASIQRLLSYQPQWMYLTHFGRVGDVPRLALALLEVLDRMVALGRAAPPGPARLAHLADGLREIYGRAVAAHGCPLAPEAVQRLLALDVGLNSQGMSVWLDREAGRRPANVPGG